MLVEPHGDGGVWPACTVCEYQGWDEPSHQAVVPNYSTSGRLLAKMMERLHQLGRVVIIKADGLRRPPNPAYTALIDDLPRVDAHSSCEAICKAALLAKMKSEVSQ